MKSTPLLLTLVLSITGIYSTFATGGDTPNQKPPLAKENSHPSIVTLSNYETEITIKKQAAWAQIYQHMVAKIPIESLKEFSDNLSTLQPTFDEDDGDEFTDGAVSDTLFTWFNYLSSHTPPVLTTGKDYGQHAVDFIKQSDQWFRSKLNTLYQTTANYFNYPALVQYAMDITTPSPDTGEDIPPGAYQRATNWLTNTFIAVKEALQSDDSIELPEDESLFDDPTQQDETSPAHLEQFIDVLGKAQSGISRFFKNLLAWATPEEIEVIQHNLKQLETSYDEVDGPEGEAQEGVFHTQALTPRRSPRLKTRSKGTDEPFHPVAVVRTRLKESTMPTIKEENDTPPTPTPRAVKKPVPKPRKLAKDINKMLSTPLSKEDQELAQKLTATMHLTKKHNIFDLEQYSRETDVNEEAPRARIVPQENLRPSQIREQERLQQRRTNWAEIKTESEKALQLQRSREAYGERKQREHQLQQSQRANTITNCQKVLQENYKERSEKASRETYAEIRKKWDPVAMPEPTATERAHLIKLLTSLEVVHDRVKASKAKGKG